MLDSNLCTHRNTYAILREAASETYGPRVYFPSYKFPIYFNLQSLLLIYIIKNTKNIYLFISIRSHFRKWSSRDWQPLYCVGCEDFICLCRCEGLVRGLLLDWYLGSQKLREILTLLCCITLSSSRENQRSAQEVERRISGAVAGEATKKSTYQVPITNPYLPHYIICHLPLVFLSPNSPFPFYSSSLSILPLFLYLPLFARSSFACVLDCLLVTMALPRFGDLHLKTLEEIESNVRS